MQQAMKFYLLYLSIRYWYYSLTKVAWLCNIAYIQVLWSLIESYMSLIIINHISLYLYIKCMISLWNGLDCLYFRDALIKQWRRTGSSSEYKMEKKFMEVEIRKRRKIKFWKLCTIFLIISTVLCFILCIYYSLKKDKGIILRM